MIKAYIFDMDGVVVDNHRYHFSAWMSFSKKYGFPLTEDIYRDYFNGKTNRDLFMMIFGDISDEELRYLGLEKELMYQKLYLPHMRPTKGLVTFLKKIKADGAKIALGTSAPTYNVDFVLDRLNLREYFDVVVDGLQVSKGKPDPEIYLLCVSKLGLDSKDCIVFEDALAGIEAGLAAGCRVVGVATSHRREELIGKVNEVIGDFSEIKQLSF